MKTRGLFLSALMMGAMFVGCSNEETPSIEPREVAKSDSFIAVNIVAPGVDSRAEDGGFEAGTDAENAVSSALFVFFDANGGFVEAVDASAEDLKPWSAGTGSIEKLSNAMIVLSNPKSAPKQVVALLNSDKKAANIGTPSLTQLKAIAGDYASTTAFTMSNSVYVNANNEIVTATALTDANIQKSEDLAKANPVTISVERVLAKVTASQAEEVNVTGKEVELDGADVTLVPEITGFKLVATNPTSYLVKNIDNYDFTWTWNDPTNWRSYWANSAVPTDGYTYFSYEDILGAENYAEYCQENTSSTPTQLLVSATIKAENNTGDAVTILKYKGLYYTEDGLKTKVNQMLADYRYESTNDSGESVTTNDWSSYIDIVDAGENAEPWEVKVALKDNAPQVDGVAAVINNMDTAAQWTDGKAYFYVAVEGLGGTPGIVRNHFHKMTINAVTGLGTPVYDPTEEIIPEKMPEEEYYVAAEIQILKWKIVAQEVELD